MRWPLGGRVLECAIHLPGRGRLYVRGPRTSAADTLALDVDRNPSASDVPTHKTVRLLLASLVMVCACSRDRERPAAGPGEPQDDPAAAPEEADAAAAEAGLYPDDAWPDVPQGNTAEGATWRTIRHETIHVHIAVPADGEVREGTLAFGHPVVFVSADGVTVEITFSSGGGVFGHGLTADPPNVVGIPVEAISATEENTTVHYVRNGQHVVKGWVRGAECSAERLAEAEVSAAFSLCSTLRVPRPGPLINAPVGSTFSLLPSQAVVMQRSAPLVYAGHFVARTVPGPCSSEEEIRAHHGQSFTLERKQADHGDLLVGIDYAEYDGVRFRSGTTVWAARAGQCCVATIMESLTPPTQEQIDYVARLCDGAP